MPLCEKHNTSVCYKKYLLECQSPLYTFNTNPDWHTERSFICRSQKLLPGEEVILNVIFAIEVLPWWIALFYLKIKLPWSPSSCSLLWHLDYAFITWTSAVLLLSAQVAFIRSWGSLAKMPFYLLISYLWHVLLKKVMKSPRLHMVFPSMSDLCWYNASHMMGLRPAPSILYKDFWPW